LLPQQRIEPPVISAQLCELPAVTRTAELTPTTETGVELSSIVPLPSWPLSLVPQHLMVAPVITAQLCEEPAATEVDACADGAISPIRVAVATSTPEVESSERHNRDGDQKNIIRS
jgi:hypothetical protein